MAIGFAVVVIDFRISCKVFKLPGRLRGRSEMDDQHPG
jgi:hypothetical protein